VNYGQIHSHEFTGDRADYKKKPTSDSAFFLPSFLKSAIFGRRQGAREA
jgi:hypothetical protein